MNTPSDLARFLFDRGEWFAAGFLEHPEGDPMPRLCRALRRQLENVPLPAWAGGPLYPDWDGNALWLTRNNVLNFSYSYSVGYSSESIARLAAGAPAVERGRWLEIKERLDSYSFPFTPVAPLMDDRFMVGGYGYTHSIPNYGRVLAEGLDGYARRVAAGKQGAERAGDARRVDFYTGLEDVLAGIAALQRRLVAGVEAGPPGPGRDNLLAALGTVPGAPAGSFYEALAAANLIFYLDGCDSLGRFDQVLGGFYQRDRAAGRITHQEAVDLVHSLWRSFDRNNAWNVALGGTAADGSAAYNELTLVCLEAARGMRRPNLALRIRRDMPDEHWDAALDTIRTGSGLPALYHEELYLEGLRENHLNIATRDIRDYAFGGCTETMVHGCSNVGSLDAGLNLPGLLSVSLAGRLETAADFAGLLAGFKQDLAGSIRDLVAQVNRDQAVKAQWRPQPMRSLLIDDCIEAGVEYNAGGARCNWSVVNVGGLANVADSLAAVRDLVYERKLVTGAEFRRALERNFEGEGDLLAEIRQCPRFGNDDERVDGLARDISSFVFQELTSHACWRGGRFLPGCLMFVTYAAEGRKVPATPDGRRAREPIADSIGPYQGRDRRGPTALLKSVARLEHSRGIGTLVLNLRLAASFFTAPAGRQAVRDLVRTYFVLGGMQVQVTVVDQKILREAIAHPERYEDLIVRIGGYSEYFNRLSPELKETVLARTEYAP